MAKIINLQRVDWDQQFQTKAGEWNSKHVLHGWEYDKNAAYSTQILTNLLPLGRRPEHG